MHEPFPLIAIERLMVSIPIVADALKGIVVIGSELCRCYIRGYCCGQHIDSPSRPNTVLRITDFKARPISSRKLSHKQLIGRKPVHRPIGELPTGYPAPSQFYDARVARGLQHALIDASDPVLRTFKVLHETDSVIQQDSRHACNLIESGGIGYEHLQLTNRKLFNCLACVYNSPNGHSFCLGRDATSASLRTLSVGADMD